MRRFCALALAITVMGTAQPASAQEPPRIELRDRLNRGEAISIELKNGRRVTGTVGDTQWDGFWVEHQADPASFVRFRAARAILDPDTGALIGIAAHGRDGVPRWVIVATLVTAGVVVGLTVATHGMFPLCLFQRCD
jgi:hypothetical protein